MISLSKKYQTRNGTPVVIYAVYPDNEYQKVQGGIIFPHIVMVSSWGLDGSFYQDDRPDCELDLVEVEQ